MAKPFRLSPDAVDCAAAISAPSLNNNSKFCAWFTTGRIRKLSPTATEPLRVTSTPLKLNELVVGSKVASTGLPLSTREIGRASCRERVQNAVAAGPVESKRRERAHGTRVQAHRW